MLFFFFCIQPYWPKRIRADPNPRIRLKYPFNSGHLSNYNQCQHLIESANTLKSEGQNEGKKLENGLALSLSLFLFHSLTLFLILRKRYT